MVAGSIRGPVFLYAVFISLALAVGVASVASFSLIRLVRTVLIMEQPAPAGYDPAPPVPAADRTDDILAAARREIRTVLLAAAVLAILAGTLLASLIGRIVIRPLKELESIAGGRFDDSDGLFASRTETHNEITGVALTFRRTLRQLEDERRHLLRQKEKLEQLQTSLVRAEKLASVGRLAAGVAHEIGNPLAAAIGYFDILRMPLAPAEHQDVLARCSAALRRIHDTIKKLLTYSRGEDDDEEPIRTLVAPVLGDTLQLLHAHPALRDVTLVDRVSGDADLAVHARAGALSQVLMNVVINAGHAIAGREKPTIEIDRTLVNDHVHITVRDNGPGIPKGLREQVFDPFFTTKPEGEGTGLGLAVSRALMERMAGDLVVGDAPSGGAELTLVLPLARE